MDSMDVLRESLANAPVIWKGDYPYFIHPITDGVPRLDAKVLSAVTDLSIEAIQEAVARYFRLKVNDLRGSQRRQSIVRPRHVAMYLCRKHVSKASFPAIGDQFGKKDHATVMNAVKKIDHALESDRSLQSQIQDLEQQLDIPKKTKS